MVAFPRRHRLSLPLWRPRGACLFGCLSPLPLALFLPPSPRPALAERSSPAGKGETKVVFLQGASPLASPALDRRRHRLFLPLWCPRGGLLFWLPVAPAFSFVFAPYPPDPRSQSALPRRGRGRPKLFHARGFAPCIPGIRPPAALVRPAAVENSMAAFPRRHLLDLPRGRGSSQTPPSLATDSSISPGPPSPWLPALHIGNHFLPFWRRTTGSSPGMQGAKPLA